MSLDLPLIEKKVDALTDEVMAQVKEQFLQYCEGKRQCAILVTTGQQIDQLIVCSKNKRRIQDMKKASGEQLIDDQTVKLNKRRLYCLLLNI